MTMVMTMAMPITSTITLTLASACTVAPTMTLTASGGILLMLFSSFAICDRDVLLLFDPGSFFLYPSPTCLMLLYHRLQWPQYMQCQD